MDVDSGVAVGFSNAHPRSSATSLGDQLDSGAPGNASVPHIGILPSTIPRPASLTSTLSATDTNATKDKSPIIASASDDKSSPHSSCTTPPGAWVRPRRACAAAPGTSDENSACRRRSGGTRVRKNLLRACVQSDGGKPSFREKFLAQRPGPDQPELMPVERQPQPPQSQPPQPQPQPQQPPQPQPQQLPPRESHPPSLCLSLRGCLCHLVTHDSCLRCLFQQSRRRRPLRPNLH